MIQYNDIQVSFNGVTLLSHFSLHIRRGEKVVITGKSGTGKSSFIKILPGFVPLDAGTVTIDKTKLTSKTVHSIRTKIAYVSQGIELFGTTVESFISGIFSFKANEHLQYDNGKIKRLFDHFELPQVLLQRPIEDLSGGEKQRVALASAVMLERPVFLLDEPTAALDVHLKQKAASFFLNNPDWTVIAVSHDREWLDESSTTVINMGEQGYA